MADTRRAPRRTEREKVEDWFFDQTPAMQARMMDTFRLLMRLKARQGAEGLLREADEESSEQMEMSEAAQ